jgi:ribonuclease P protein component
MIGRLMQSADFQRLLATPARSRSAHFALHHVAQRPSATGRRTVHPSSTGLSTRHARRSVTRNLLRRQIRSVMADRLPQLPPGLWLVRLRTPFAREQFVSAASDALRQAARVELQQLFGRAARTA